MSRWQSYSQDHLNHRQQRHPSAPQQGPTSLSISSVPRNEWLQIRSASESLSSRGYVVLSMEPPGVGSSPGVSSSSHADGKLTLFERSGVGGIVSFMQDACIDEHLDCPLMGTQVRKDWEDTKMPVGARTQGRAVRATLHREAAQLVQHTMNMYGLQGFGTLHSLYALQNEPAAPRQMLHYDLLCEHRNIAVTVICAICEPFHIHVMDNHTHIASWLLVPRGAMVVLGGWCYHGGAAAEGVLPRLFGVVRPAGRPDIKPGTHYA